MIKHNQVKVVLLLCLLYVCFSAACRHSAPYSTIPIAENVIVNERPREVDFAEPYKPRKQVSKICFEYTDSLSAYDIAKWPQFSDGTDLRITASVVEEDGNSYDLDHIENSVDNYICLIPGDDRWVDFSKPDKTFVKLIVNSNRTIHFSKIEWVAYNSWDL